MAPNPIGASDFGVTGILDVPTARMADDGEFSLAISRQRVADVFNLSYQATPWFETTFRYTIFNPRHVFRSNDQRKDRSYEVKIRLIKEGGYRPQLAVGARDILGSGLWGSEYLVASKKFGHLDATLGIGWGRFAERALSNNPFNLIDDRFGDRNRETGGSFGGKLRGLSFFRGKKVGFLGGFSYDLPKFKARLLAEYNADEYESEKSLRTMRDTSPWSYGIEWGPHPGLDFAVSRQHGNQWAIRMVASVNTTSIPTRKRPPRYFSSAEPRSKSHAPAHIDLSSPYDRLLYDFERSGLLLRGASISGESAVAKLELSNESYTLAADAIHRALTLGEAHMPPHIDTISIVVNERNSRPATIDYDRHRKALTNKLDKTVNQIEISTGKKLENRTNVTDYRVPALAFGLDLAARIQLMDPVKPLRHQIYAKLSGRLKLGEGWNLWSIYAQDVTNNFSPARTSKSPLPRVRSDVNRYLTRGDSGLDAAYLEYRGGSEPNFYYRFYAGVLEEMYTGIGSEILFKPFSSRWSIGITSNWIQLRKYDRGFGLRDYRTTTGFVSVYYASPLYDFDFAVHGGRYLARDLGVSYEARRNFPNGFSIGAFFTTTNLSEQEYGQGGFDKGISITIPINSFSRSNTRNTYSTIVRSLERDGGRRLENFGSTLWWEIRPYHYERLDAGKFRMLPE